MSGIRVVAKVTLDRETFKALASETRLAVLRALDERRKTGSELARELDLNKATVHEHLQLLADVGLVKKLDEGRKWIYYELTWQGQRLLHPEATTTFSVLLGLSVAAAGGGFAMLGRALGWWLGGGDAAPLADDGAQPEGDSAAEMAATSPSPTPEASTEGGGFFDDGGWISLALFATAVLLAVLAVVLVRRSGPSRVAPNAES